MDASALLLNVAGVLIPLFEDDDVYELNVQNGGRVFGVRGTTGPFDAGLVMDPDRLGFFLDYAAQVAGVEFGPGDADLSCELPEGEPFRGARLQVKMPPFAVGGSQLSIRKKPRTIKAFENYVTDGTLSQSSSRFLLDGILKQDFSVLVVGSVDAGKTTLLNSLYQEIGRLQPLRRIAVLERGASEIWLPNGNSIIQVAKVSRQRDGAKRVGLDAFVGDMLRMGPKTLVLSELRNTEDVDAAINGGRSGHRGGAATLHAGSAYEGLQRLEVIARPGKYGPDVGESLAAVFGSVVFIERCPDGASHHVFKGRVYTVRWQDGFLLDEVK